MNIIRLQPINWILIVVLLLIFSNFFTINYCYAQLPERPSVNVTTQHTLVTISWNHVAHANGYELFYAPYPSAYPYKRIDMHAGTQITVNLPLGAAYFVLVRAYNDSGVGPLSEINHFVLNRPGESGLIAEPNITSTVQGSGNIRFTLAGEWVNGYFPSLDEDVEVIDYYYIPEKGLFDKFRENILILSYKFDSAAVTTDEGIENITLIEDFMMPVGSELVRTVIFDATVPEFEIDIRYMLMEIRKMDTVYQFLYTAERDQFNHYIGVVKNAFQSIRFVKPLGPQYAFNQYSSIPQILFDGSNYLAIYCSETEVFHSAINLQKSTAVFNGLLVTEQGEVLNRFSIEPEYEDESQTTNCRSFEAALAYNSQIFFVIYDYGEKFKGLKGVRIDKNGHLLDEKPFYISANYHGLPLSAKNPTITTDGENFFIAYTGVYLYRKSIVSPEVEELKGTVNAIVSADGEVLHRNLFINHKGENPNLDIKVAYDGEHYYGAWIERFYDGTKLNVQRFTSKGKAIDRWAIVVRTDQATMENLKLLSDSDRILFTWNDYNHYYAALMSHGQPLQSGMFDNALKVWKMITNYYHDAFFKVQADDLGFHYFMHNTYGLHSRWTDKNMQLLSSPIYYGHVNGFSLQIGREIQQGFDLAGGNNDALFLFQARNDGELLIWPLSSLLTRHYKNFISPEY